MKPNWRILFVITSAAVFVAILFDLQVLYRTSKPLLMITLLMYFITASKAYPKWRKFVMLALIFSWGGDVLLLADDLFVVGLASFLLAHIFYIIAYQYTGAAKGRIRPLDITKIALAGAIMTIMLYPHLGGMLVPVLGYATVLLSMALWAHKRRGATSADSFFLVSTGALLFVVSDALIAINKFAVAVPGERMLVMSSYIAAQYMIVQGLLKHESA